MSDARILVVDDEANIRELLDEILSEEGYDVTTAEDAEHAREARRGRNFDLTLLDIWMPDTDGITLLKEWADSGSLGPVVMMSGHATVDTAVEATRLGALDFIEKPVSLSQLLRTVSKALTGRGPAKGSAGALAQAVGLVGKSAAMRTLRERIQTIARHDTHVLFTGEPGSGRTAAARHLAGASRRSSGPFEVVAGAELGADEAEAVLFGTETLPGVLGLAAGGTLFIEGIDRTSARAQTILLGALTGTPPGGTDRVDLRILASAPPAFEQDTKFRPELMSLIASVVVRVPPLRDHSEDVPEFLRYYTEALVDREGLPFRRFDIAAQNRLRNYPWPGNVRELKHLVKQLLVVGGGDITLAEVEAELVSEGPDSEPLIKKDLLAMPLREAREHFERAYLQQQLQLCGGKVGQLAKRVGMERTHLYRKLRALGVDFRHTGPED
jgi:DNA-binding NtrC family response regulator